MSHVVNTLTTALVLILFKLKYWYVYELYTLTKFYPSNNFSTIKKSNLGIN